VSEILSAASADDPAVRLQNLEREVDLVRITIKRILMDIRERMNELENPLVIVSSPRPPAPARKVVAPEIPQMVPQPEPRPDAVKITPEPQREAISAAPVRDATPAPCRPLITETALPAPSHDRPAPPPRPPWGEAAKPLPLPAAFELFCWTQDGVKKYGHTQFEVLVETYRIMGYIGLSTSREVHQVSRLMPLCSVDEYEIGPEDFVSGIYLLKRIVSPGDTSLDRDMVDALMAQRREVPSATGLPVTDIPTGPGATDIYGFGKRDREWMNLRA